jgi:hypothetical protein
LKKKIKISQKIPSTKSKNKMKKLQTILMILSVALAATSCAPKHFTYASYKDDISPEFKVQIRKVKVNLTEQTVFAEVNEDSQYLNPRDLALMVNEVAVKQLQKDSLYPSVTDQAILQCELELNYERKFTPFTNDSYSGSTINGYKITVYKGEKLIATKVSTARHSVNFGFIQVVKKLSESDEKKAVEAFAGYIAGDLKLLGK